MTLYAAFDTSATTTVICIIAGRDGSPVFETTVPTDPDALYAALAPYLPRLQRVGVEAGSWSAWLHRELSARGAPMVILETRHAAAALQASATRPTRTTRAA